jgi:hypothetical protein
MAGSLLSAKPVAGRDTSAQNNGLATNHPATTAHAQRVAEGLAEDGIPLAGENSIGNSSAPVAFYGEVVVTWESAAPIRLVRREPLPPDFENRYAVRITGLPAQTFMPETGRTPVIFRLLMGTTIEVNAGKRRQSDYVLRLPDKNSVVFAFPVAGFPLTRADRFVSFAMDLNQMMVRARFDLRLMTFGETIAV